MVIAIDMSVGPEGAATAGLGPANRVYGTPVSIVYLSGIWGRTSDLLLYLSLCFWKLVPLIIIMAPINRFIYFIIYLVNDFYFNISIQLNMYLLSMLLLL